MAFCKSCGAEIVWVKTNKGQAMPCDSKKVMAAKDDKGKDLLVTPSGNVVRVNLAATITENNVVIGYISHFATCPNANGHRRTK